MARILPQFFKALFLLVTIILMYAVLGMTLWYEDSTNAVDAAEGKDKPTFQLHSSLVPVSLRPTTASSS